MSEGRSEFVHVLMTEVEVTSLVEDVLPRLRDDWEKAAAEREETGHNAVVWREMATAQIAKLDAIEVRLMAALSGSYEHPEVTP